jgi:hypothetical protein
MLQLIWLPGDYRRVSLRGEDSTAKAEAGGHDDEKKQLPMLRSLSIIIIRPCMRHQEVERKRGERGTAGRTI